jgi:hypothetical protein
LFALNMRKLRYGVGRVGQVRPNEDFKMDVRAAPVIPALADRPAPAAGAGEADGHREGAARPFPLMTEIFAGNAGGLMRASSPPARAIVARQGRDAKGGSVRAQRR